MSWLTRLPLSGTHSAVSTPTRTADNVRAEMARRGVRQTTLAACLGLSQAAVSRRVTGGTEFSVAELLTVAGLLGVSPASLLGEAAMATPAA